MELIIFLGCITLAVVLITADKPKDHERIAIYRHRCVRIDKVPPVEVAQLN